MRTGLVLVPAAVLASVLVACGGGGGGDGGGTTTGPKAVASVSLSPSTAQSMIVTRTLQVTATTKDDAGATLTGRAISWSVSPGTLAQLSSTSGSAVTLTALGAGDVQLTASSEGKSSAPLAITIAPQTLTTVSVTPDVVSLLPGATQQLSVAGADQGGAAMSGVTATFGSSNPSVARVDATTGLVTAVAAGGPVTITATASAGGVTKTATAAVTVQQLSATASVDAVGTTAWSPARVDITAGGTVTYNNPTTAPHSVEFSGTAAGKPANTATFNTGQSVTVTFPTAGTFPYNCGIHPNMTGTVVVH